MSQHTFGANGGWIEVLFRRQPKPFRRLVDIHSSDYTMIGSPVPVREVVQPYDVYVMLHDGRFSGAQRPVAHGDVLNVRLPQRVCSYVLLLPAAIKASMEDGRYELDIDGKRPLGMQLLSQRFHSFWEEKCAT